PGGRRAGGALERAGGVERGREVGEADRRADGGGGQEHPAAAARHREAVPDADRGYFLHLGARHGGDGTDRARQGEGRGRSGDRRLPRDAQEGGDGRGEGQRAAGRRSGGGQRRAAAARERQRGRRARGGAGPGRVARASPEATG